jgi:hypothetical protein
MSQDPSHVFLGLWVNWTRGQVAGSTITMTSAHGIILASCLAIYIQISGTHLWHLLRYLMHQLRTTERATHPMQRQIQAVLKNNNSAIAMSIQLLRVAWAWRARSPPWFSGIFLPLIGFAFATGITLAGILSSGIVSTTNVEVLLSSPHCGDFYYAPRIVVDGAELMVVDTPGAIAHRAFFNEGELRGVTYANQCYNGTSPWRCNDFTVQTLGWTTDYQAPCPFADKMCVGPAMTMDTGLLNSNDMLGFNLPKHEQIGFRKVSTCAPTIHDDYIRTVFVNVTRVEPNRTVSLTDTLYYYMYGPAQGSMAKRQPWTTAYSNSKSNISGYDIT